MRSLYAQTYACDGIPLSNPQAEEDYYTDDVYHVLAKYFPCFGDVRPMNSWAGQYAINGFDELPVVKSIPGMIYVGSASGSGIMKCDREGGCRSLCG